MWPKGEESTSAYHCIQSRIKYIMNIQAKINKQINNEQMRK